MKHIKRFLFTAPSAERPVEFVDPFPLMNLPEQLIEYVLSFVSHEDLLKSCRYTCKLFREIIDSNGFWKIKCLRDGKSLPMFHLEELPQRYYQRIYIGNPYGRNLLRNGHGDSPKGAFTSWRIIENGGDGWKYEETPKGADPLPLDKQGCFSTSYGACTKQQVISLVNEGILPEILDNFKPHIEVSEWCAYIGSLPVETVAASLEVSTDRLSCGRKCHLALGGSFERFSLLLVTNSAGVSMG